MGERHALRSAEPGSEVSHEHYPCVCGGYSRSRVIALRSLPFALTPRARAPSLPQSTGRSG